MKLKKAGAKASPKKKAAPKKKRNTKMVDLSMYNDLATEYNNISEQIKVLNKRKSELSELLKEGAEKFGKEDDRGSNFLFTNDFSIGRIRKITMKINEEKGYEFLNKFKDKNGKTLKDCVNQVTKFTVDEEALAKAVQDERISLDEVREGVYDIKENYQVSVNPISEEDEMPEVEQSTLKKG